MNDARVYDRGRVIGELTEKHKPIGGRLTVDDLVGHLADEVASLRRKVKFTSDAEAQCRGQVSMIELRAEQLEKLEEDRKRTIEFLLEQIEEFKKAITASDVEMKRLQELLGKAHGYSQPVVLAKAPAFDLGISRLGAFLVCHTCGGGIYKYENVASLYCPFCEKELNRPAEMRMMPPARQEEQAKEEQAKEEQAKEEQAKEEQGKELCGYERPFDDAAPNEWDAMKDAKDAAFAESEEDDGGVDSGEGCSDGLSPGDDLADALQRIRELEEENNRLERVHEIDVKQIALLCDSLSGAHRDLDALRSLQSRKAVVAKEGAKEGAKERSKDAAPHSLDSGYCNPCNGPCVQGAGGG